MKKSELKELVRKLVTEAMPGYKETDEIPDIEPSGKSKEKVKELFDGSMAVTLSDIEEIAHSFVKDADQADSLYEELLKYARSLAPTLGYLPDARGEFFIRRSTHQGLTRQYGEKLKKPLHPLWTREESNENLSSQESKLNVFKKLILETVEEVKTEDNKSTEDAMFSVLKMLKEHNKKYSFRKNKAGNYEVIGCSPTQIEVRPMYMGSYDVIFMLDGTDREKKMNLNLKGVKEFIKEKLTSKLENYTKSAYNKTSVTGEDVTRTRTAGLPETKQNGIKKVGGNKNENKDYNEADVKVEYDMPDKHLKQVGDVKKQNSHDDDAGAKYTFPKQDKDGKKHVIKGGKGKELKLPEKKIAKK